MDNQIIMGITTLVVASFCWGFLLGLYVYKWID